MGREIIPNAIEVEGERISLDSLIGFSEAQRYLGLSTTLMYREMSRREDMDSFAIMGARLLLRAAVEALKSDLESTQNTVLTRSEEYTEAANRG